MIATFFYFSNVLNSGLSFFSGLVCWRSIWVQVKGQLSGGTGPVPTALFMTLNVGEPLHFIYTSPSSLFMLVWCTCVFQVPVQVSAATLPSSLKRGGSAWARRPLLLTPTPTCPSEGLPRVKPVRTTGRNPRSNACPPRWMLCQLIELTVLPPEGRTQIILEKESDVELWGAETAAHVLFNLLCLMKNLPDVLLPELRAASPVLLRARIVTVPDFCFQGFRWVDHSLHSVCRFLKLLLTTPSCIKSQSCTLLLILTPPFQPVVLQSRVM